MQRCPLVHLCAATVQVAASSTALSSSGSSSDEQTRCTLPSLTSVAGLARQFCRASGCSLRLLRACIPCAPWRGVHLLCHHWRPVLVAGGPPRFITHPSTPESQPLRFYAVPPLYQ